MAANGANGTVDLRGEFIRGWDAGRGVESERLLGSWEQGSVGGMSDALDPNGEGSAFIWSTGAYGYADRPNGFNADAAGVLFGANGTDRGRRSFPVSRPRNVALLACMKV